MTGKELSKGSWKKVYSLNDDETKVISLRKVGQKEKRSQTEFNADIKIFREGGLLHSLLGEYKGPIADKVGKCVPTTKLKLCWGRSCSETQEIDYFTSSKFTYSLDRFVETDIFRNDFKTFKDKFKDCLVFLKKMHDIKVGHFDLKEDNIGVYMNGESLDKIILMDWGTAQINTEAQVNTKLFGTPDYWDYEMDKYTNGELEDREPDILKSDVYSIGIVLVSIFIVASLVSNGKRNIFKKHFETYMNGIWKIFGKYKDIEDYAAIKKEGLEAPHKFKELLESLRKTDKKTNMLSENEIPKLVELVENMLKQHRTDRFDMNQVINHEFWTTQ